MLLLSFRIAWQWCRKEVNLWSSSLLHCSGRNKKTRRTLYKRTGWAHCWDLLWFAAGTGKNTTFEGCFVGICWQVLAKNKTNTWRMYCCIVGFCWLVLKKTKQKNKISETMRSLTWAPEVSFEILDFLVFFSTCQQNPTIHPSTVGFFQYLSATLMIQLTRRAQEQTRRALARLLYILARILFLIEESS